MPRGGTGTVGDEGYEKDGEKHGVGRLGFAEFEKGVGMRQRRALQRGKVCGRCPRTEWRSEKSSGG